MGMLTDVHESRKIFNNIVDPVIYSMIFAIGNMVFRIIWTHVVIYFGIGEYQNRTEDFQNIFAPMCVPT